MIIIPLLINAVMHNYHTKLLKSIHATQNVIVYLTTLKTSHVLSNTSEFHEKLSNHSFMPIQKCFIRVTTIKWQFLFYCLYLFMS